MRPISFSLGTLQKGVTQALNLRRASTIQSASKIMEARPPPHKLAIVTCEPGDADMNIEFLLAGIHRSMKRDRKELLENTLKRIQINAMPKAKKGKKKESKGKNDSPRAKPDVSLLQGSSKVMGSVFNDSAWQHGNILVVGETSYKIVRNPPAVEKVTVHGKPMVAYPLCPVPQLKFAKLSTCLWQWFRQDRGSWEPIEGADKMIYVPGNLDLGHRLKVVCTPSGQIEGSDEVWKGEPAETLIDHVVDGPSWGPGSYRHLFTKEPLQTPGIRVMTYNLLADQYASTEYAQKRLFSYCPQKFRDAAYRRPLALQEIIGYNADIICLQEVDAKAFEIYFQPQLQAAGFLGFYSNKDGSTREGCALFYRKSRFKAVGAQSVFLKKLINEIKHGFAQNEQENQLEPILWSSGSLQDTLDRVSTIGQMLILEPKNAHKDEGRYLVVNTHLFFHPRANHIRTIHTSALLTEAENFLRKCPSDQETALLFCGDLNSGCNKGIPGNLELLGTGHLPADYWDWDHGRTFRFVKDLEQEETQASTDSDSEKESEKPKSDSSQGKVKGKQGRKASQDSQHEDKSFRAIPLSHNFKLDSADKLRTPFTNYVKGFQSTLDYVWHDRKRLKVEREIPLPTEEEVKGFIPSERFPSDHLAVVFDLQWKDRAEQDDSTECKPQIHNRIFQAAEQNINMGLHALKLGGVVAVPTDTLYGIGACAEVSEGIQRLYTIKKRLSSKPLAICVGKPSDVRKYGDCSNLPQSLLEELLPGPVTVVLNRKPDSPLSAHLNPGVPTIGIRVPDSPFILKLCEAIGGALALTSANISGASSSLKVEDFQAIWHQCGLIYDAGPIPEKPAGSTIVDLSEKGVFKITRPGIAEDNTCRILETHGLQKRDIDA